MENLLLQYEFKDVKLFEAEDSFLEMLLDYQDKTQPIFYPLDIQNTRAFRKHGMRIPPSKTWIFESTFAIQGDKIIATMDFMYSNGEKEQNPDTCEIHITVDPDYQNKGISNKFLRIFLEKAEKQGKSKYEVWMNDKTLGGLSERIVQKLPLKLASEEKSNRLLKDEVDLENINSQIAKYEQNLSRYKLLRYNNRGYWERVVEDEAFRVNQSEFFNEVINLIPKENSTDNDYIRTPNDFLIQAETNLKYTGENIRLLLLDGDNTIAFSQVYYAPDELRKFGTGLTGVRKEYHRQGIASFLKTKMLKILVDEFPEFQYLETENAQSNKGMLFINTKMGFRHVFSWKHYEGKISDLINYIG